MSAGQGTGRSAGVLVGMFDKLRGELIDIIEMLDDSRDTIVWRFPRYQNEIKMGAQLIVRESQVAVFVNEGHVVDCFVPGRYTLQTQNMPLLSTLKGWKYGFNSPFKCEVYFVNTRQFTDMKWGTQNPVMMRDPEFGMVRLRAFGAFAARVVDAPALLRELAGTDPEFRTEEIDEYLRQMIVSRLGPALAASGVPAIDLVTQQAAIGDRLAGALSQELAPVGIQIPKFLIENISLPPEVEEALDKRTQMGVLGNLDQYAKFQAANAIQDAANNPGGGGEAMGIGLGMALGQQAAGSFAQPGQAPPQQQPVPQHAPAGPPPPQQAPAGPPPLPPQEQWYLGANGQQLGPFDQARLSQQVAGGVLAPNTLVWKAGMNAWLPASQVPELAQLLSSTPPPLPPQS